MTENQRPRTCDPAGRGDLRLVPPAENPPTQTPEPPADQPQVPQESQGTARCGKRGQFADPDHRRVAHGLYVERVEGLDHLQEFLRDLRAYQEVLPDDAVYTHLTGARLLGWDVPPLPETLPVFAATAGPRAPRRPGLLCARLSQQRTPFRDLPVPVDQPAEILLRCARDLGLVDLVILLNSALRLRHLHTADLDAVLESRRPGTVKLRQAWELANPRSRSAGTSLLGLFHRTLGVRAESAVTLRNIDGDVIATADFVLNGCVLVHDVADGVASGEGTDRPDEPGHNPPRGTPAEATSSPGFMRQVFTPGDLLNDAPTCAARIDRALGRPPRRHDLARWRRLISESLYGPEGRERLLNRWHRDMGVREFYAG